MKKQQFKFSTWPWLPAMIMILSLITMAELKAQTTITTTSVKDITIPGNKDKLHVFLRGGDGGRAGKSIGGVGATVEGFVSIGTATHEIAPGGTLRFIPGQAGEDNENGGGGGGGGTALVYQETENSNWVILAVAGGGGGASINRTIGMFGIKTKTGYDGGPGKLNAQGTGADTIYPGYSGGGAFGGTQQKPLE